jgi:hypothetical protein
VVLGRSSDEDRLVIGPEPRAIEQQHVSAQRAFHANEEVKVRIGSLT